HVIIFFQLIGVKFKDLQSNLDITSKSGGNFPARYIETRCIEIPSLIRSIASFELIAVFSDLEISSISESVSMQLCEKKNFLLVHLRQNYVTTLGF
ncbi:hypothetical protein BpHYR1_045625, partial [Brachionus plicatilis]